MRKDASRRTLLSSALVARGLSMVKRKPKPKPKNQRQARYTWRPVVELHWVVVRLNENGSESFHSRYDAEEEAKDMAAMMDKAAREGREERREGSRPTWRSCRRTGVCFSCWTERSARMGTDCSPVP